MALLNDAPHTARHTFGNTRVGWIAFGGSAGTIWKGTHAGVPTGGAGWASPGSEVTDITNKKLYINTNTLASPTWTVVGTQS